MRKTLRKKLVQLALGGTTFVLLGGLGFFDAANCGITNNLRTDLIRSVGDQVISTNIDLANNPALAPHETAIESFFQGIWDSFVGSQIPQDPINANALLVQ